MRNNKVVINSIVALIFIFLAFAVDWIFLAGAVILMLINKRELFKA
ncbi:hypothetical protein HOD88_01220 [archaeon]|jgi:hypothetical protein|nr:hypothetical protein [archaeon]